MDRLKYHDILYDDDQLGPYPEHLLRRVDKPTNRMPGPIPRRDERSKLGFRTLMGEFGDELQHLAERMTVRYPIGRVTKEMVDHVNRYEDFRKPTAPKTAPIPDDPRVMSRHLKSFGYFLGADVMGIGPLSQSAVYTYDVRNRRIEAPYKYAIVFGVRKNEMTVSASNGWDDIMDACSMQAYQRLAMQTEQLAAYLRQLGHDAVPTAMDRYLTVMPQVILEAGLGEVCRMGIVLNPFLGCNFKAAAVLTNVELELDKPIDFGLQEYCTNCTICADHCPTRAITRGQQNKYQGYYTWLQNMKTCGNMHIENVEGCVCGRCTKVCPWHRPDMEPRDYAQWDGNLEWLHQTVNEQRDRNIANNYVDPREYTRKWWFRLDEVGDEIIRPMGKNKLKYCKSYPLQEE
jgi:NAD-dependent dihydropyrimidine dehydrogenase PreA subunit